jgi:hypothetical protein
VPVEQVVYRHHACHATTPGYEGRLGPLPSKQIVR